MVAETVEMRGLRSTLILLVVALGLGAYIYFVERHRAPASEEGPNQKVFNLETDDIAKLRLTVAGSDVTEIERADTTWRLTTPVAVKADETTVSSITSSLASLEIRRVVEEGRTELEPFGLSEPALDVGFARSGEEFQHLLIGDETPTGSDRYAKLAYNDRVFLIAGYLNSTFNKTTFDLRDKTILEFHRDSIDKFEIVSEAQTIQFVKVDELWRLAKPWDTRADFSAVESILGRLSTNNIRSVENEATDELEQFGLSDPNVTVTLTAGSTTATLLVGNETQSGNRYARDVARSMVFTLDSSLFTDLKKNPGDYRNKALFGFRPFNSTRLEIQQKDGMVVFEKTEATEEDSEDSEDAWARIEPAPAEANQNEMDNLLTKLSNLRAQSFVESKSETGFNNDPLATILVRFGDEGVEDRVVVWRFGEETFAVHGDEPGAAQIDTQAFDEVLGSLEAVQTDDSDTSS